MLSLSCSSRLPRVAPSGSIASTVPSLSHPPSSRALQSGGNAAGEWFGDLEP